MKRIYFCTGLFVVIFAFAFMCNVYVSATVEQTAQLLADAAESRRNGDSSAASEAADSAWEKWSGLAKYSGYVLSDLTIVADVTVSLARVGMLAQTDDSDRFLEECTATIVLLELFLADNQRVLGGMRAK